MNYPILSELPQNGEIYVNEHMGVLEALVPPGKWKTAHAPTLLELSNSDLLCAWFAGSFEGRGDVSIVCSRLGNGSKNWEEPVQISDDPERSEQNPSLFLGPKGEIWAIYTSQLDRIPGKDNMQYTSVIRRQRSTDGGLTWSEPDVLISKEGSFCRQPIQILENGRWIFANWLCRDSESGLEGDPTVFYISDNDGASWRMVEMPESSGRVHANIIELEPGNLIAFMRSRFADFIYCSTSDDAGDTWCEPFHTELPNNNSSISAIKLQSGRIAIAYNPTHAYDSLPGVGAWPGLRCPVAVALSEDGGKTWPLIRNMELGEGFVGEENKTNNNQYEYPFLIQSSDEKLHLVFAYRNRIGIKWMSFTEDDVMGSRREKMGIYNPTSEKI